MKRAMWEREPGSRVGKGHPARGNLLFERAPDAIATAYPKELERNVFLSDT